ncbi:MAG: hypothetical protein KDM81_04990, partial [Verrucomicrobiae bacterium]|nr:hypothetical protein [Verrucomicrobiae bacterium]
LLYAGDGFEVNEPLCTKMEAQPHDAQPFDLLSPGRRYYDYEFERYWYFYQVFGRVGYNPDTPAEVWQREFQKRFGQDAAPFIEKGLHLASGVLPRIVASCYPYRAFPMTRGWAEKQRLGDLPEYAKAEGSDIQLFVCFDEEARLLVEGGETAKVRPAENSGWFAQTAADIDQQVAQAERRIGEHRNREFESTVTDLRILSNLARFHSRRIPAAVNYRLFERTGDPRALDAAIAHERSAIEAWRQLVEAAGDFYTADLMMGVSGADLCGHWKDELALLNKGLEALEQRQREPGQEPFVQIAPRFPPVQTEEVDSAPEVIHQPVTMAAVGQPLSITAVARDPEGVKWVRLRYRHVNQQEDYRSLPMLPLADGDRYQATVPAQDVVSAWDLMYFIEVMDRRGNGRIHPDLNQQTPYFIVHLQR